MKLGILPLGRPTFDVPFAEENLNAMLAALDATDHAIVGTRDLLFDAEATRAAINTLQDQEPDHVLILQVTFTDASMTVEIANAFAQPLSIWAIPEPRLGGRLRLNSLCGLNLASHALSLSGRGFTWEFAAPAQANLEKLFAPVSSHVAPLSKGTPTETSTEIVARLNGKSIARIGERPDGFHTCDYDKAALKSLAGVSVTELDLPELFETAKAEPEPTGPREIAERDLGGLEKVDQTELTRSLKLKSALETLRAKGHFDAFAIRCWPETFTQYGGAICGPVAQMGEARVPCACEADVYGALTQLILQDVADAPVFLADLVDIDPSDDTGVLWHCGQAPVSMRDPHATPTATIHTNRKMPLLYEYPLKEGRVTLMRVSQSKAGPRMILAGGDMLKRPMAFTGTSGVVRFDTGASRFLDQLISHGVEHHTAMAYGDHRETLRAVAGALDIPILEI